MGWNGIDHAFSVSMTNKHAIDSINLLKNRVFLDNLPSQAFDGGQRFDSGEGRTTSLPFDLSEEVRGGYTVLFLQGVYNTQTIKFLKPRLYELSEERGCRVVVDLKKALFIDVSCLGAFLKAHRIAYSKGGNIVFVNRNDHIRGAFEAVHMDRILNIVPNLAAAHDFFAAKEEAI
ncbi:MAG: hypothetical protein BA863_09665 [Desulfovibrio sp. S3730MH75]|nr:MAG: hypothetical protein BA863_09665 [Desulfovibrio sp. S3730MH75]